MQGLMDMSDGKYSVIMTAFDGNWIVLATSAPRELGYAGGSLGTLVLRDELPSEVAAFLTADEARRISTALEALGTKIEVVETANVADVKHRAYELFPTQEGKCFSFTEIEGMIFTLSPLNAWDLLQHLRESDAKLQNWVCEYQINHEHVGFSGLDGTERELIRQGNDLVEQLKQDVRLIYPDRNFVICHDYKGSIIAFYQASEDAPKETRWLRERNPEKTWCPQCSRPQPYYKRTDPDAEFPEADWGDCAVCGNEVLVAAPEVLILVGPET
jgi:hypothetical protein